MGSWGVELSGVLHADQNETLPSLGGCELRNVRHFRGLQAGPAEGPHTQIRMKPRRPWGLRTAKMWPPSFAFGLPSGVMSYADQKEASASLAANCQAVTTFVGSWEARRSGVTRNSE